jgi:hypothetical protein
MYNIAICISGEPRHYTEGVNSIKNILNKRHKDINIDIFYHFWNNITEVVSQQRYHNIVNAPVRYNIDSKILETSFSPTIGVCESKDTLDPDIKITFDYLQELIKKYNVCKFPSYKAWEDTWQNANDFSFKVKNTNIPTLSQIISFFRCQKLRILHEINKNIKYDLIIRTRSDILFDLPKKIHNIVSEKQIKAVQFKKLRICTDTVLYGEPGFYVFSSYIIKNNIFDNYINKIKKLMFRVKEKDNQKLHVLTDHSIIPEYFTSQRCAIEAPSINWSWSLKSSKINL